VVSYLACDTINTPMSLGIAFKGPEGIVLAADSRVTLNATQPQPNGGIIIIPATFDNATKLLRIKGQEFVGAVTYGVGAIGQQAPRTAHSFLPELETKISTKRGNARLNVEDFAKELSEFFMEQWTVHMAGVTQQAGNDMVFVIGGYDEQAPYGRVFEFFIPSKPAPIERLAGAGDFGAVWGGQREFVDRLINGYDPRAIDLAETELGLDAESKRRLTTKLSELMTPIPFQFLPLQDCVDLSIFLIRTTIKLQTWTVGLRGVGGAVDVATITKTDGFQAIQVKQIIGEKNI
jgi:hypothetical protein